MPRYHFPGFPAFLDAAAAEIGRPGIAGPARREPTLSAIATLCGQAADADSRHVADILAEAEELADRLRVTHRASELMLADVRAGRFPTEKSNAPPRNRCPRSATQPIALRGATRRHG